MNGKEKRDERQAIVEMKPDLSRTKGIRGLETRTRDEILGFLDYCGQRIIVTYHPSYYILAHRIPGHSSIYYRAKLGYIDGLLDEYEVRQRLSYSRSAILSLARATGTSRIRFSF